MARRSLQRGGTGSGGDGGDSGIADQAEGKKGEGRLALGCFDDGGGNEVPIIQRPWITQTGGVTTMLSSCFGRLAAVFVRLVPVESSAALGSLRFAQATLRGRSRAQRQGNGPMSGSADKKDGGGRRGVDERRGEEGVEAKAEGENRMAT